MLALFNLLAGLACLIVYSHSEAHLVGGIGFIAGALWLFPLRPWPAPFADSLRIVAAVLLLSAAILGFSNEQTGL